MNIFLSIKRTNSNYHQFYLLYFGCSAIFSLILRSGIACFIGEAFSDSIRSIFMTGEFAKNDL